MSIESVMPSKHLMFCHSLLLLPSIFPSIRVFFDALHIRWPKYWSFSFSISPSNEYSGLSSFRIDWLYLLSVQGTLKSLRPTSQFKRVNSLALSFLYSPTLTSTCDYWKNHGFDYTDVYCLYLEMVCLFIEDHKESKTNKNKTFLELSSASSQDKKSTDKS